MSFHTLEDEVTHEYDGEGHPLKITERQSRVDIIPPQQGVLVTKYQVWSSVDDE